MNDLAEIFSLDPLQLTKDDPRLLKMIEYHREKRAQYLAGDKSAGKKEKKPGKDIDLSLDDLGL